MNNLKKSFSLFLIILCFFYGSSFIIDKYRNWRGQEDIQNKQKLSIILKDKKFFLKECEDIADKQEQSIYFDSMFIPEINDFVFVCVLKEKRVSYYSDFKNKKLISDLNLIKDLYKN